MIYNQWYIILESKELKERKPTRITRLGGKLILWRDKEEKVCCIEDRCQHRGAPLTCGKIVNGDLECPYFGYHYDKTGVVTSLHENNRNFIVHQNMKVDSYTTYENYGFIWLWWGDEKKITDTPFFFKELQNFSYSGFKDNWGVHYSQAIENQLDVEHLALIHKTTIGRGNKTSEDKHVVFRVDEMFTSYFAENENKNKNIVLKPEEIKEYRHLFYQQFHLPNLLQNYISDNIRTLIAFVPVDDEKTIIYIRFYQNVFRNPTLKKLMNFLGKVSGNMILRQDKKVVITRLPKFNTMKTDSKETNSNATVLEYRKYKLEANDKLKG